MTLKKLCLGMLAFSLLAIPAVAQKSSNKGGAARADKRSDMVQKAKASKGKKDKDHDPARDNDKKNRGRHTGETQGQHKANGHSR